jgi:predicted metal-dependent phosphoesterase TrpH
MKIDLHVHTSERSPCGRSTEEAQIQAAMAAGLDAIYFTDHYRLAPAARLAELNRRCAPFCIFNGIEIGADGEDFLVLGLPDPALERNDWSYPALHAHVRRGGGFLVLAHPFRYHAGVIAPVEQYPPDAIEVYSYNTPPAAEAEIRAIAARLGLLLLSNSDAHSAERLGRYYNVLPDGGEDERAILLALRSGPVELFK